MICKINATKLNIRNQLAVGEGFRERTKVISVPLTIKLTGKERNHPSIRIMALKNSIWIKSFVNKMTTQSRNNMLHIKATRARNNSQRIFFGEKYH